MMDTFKTLRALKAMLDDPATTDNEKENARELLDRFAHKHDLDVDEVLRSNHKPKERQFLYKQEWEQNLLFQIVAKITRSNPERYIYSKRDSMGRSRRVKGLCAYDLTDEEYADVLRALEVYLPAYEFEMERLYKSFVQRHRLFNEDVPAVTLEPEEYRKSYGLLGGLIDIADPNTKRLNG